MNETVSKLKAEAEKLGLLITINETLYMSTKKVKQGSSYKTDNTQLEQVDSFKYLGSIVNNDNTGEEEIKERIAAGNKVLYANKKMMFSKQITRRCTVRFYKSRIRVVGTYGFEIWVLEDMHEQI